MEKNKILLAVCGIFVAASVLVAAFVPYKSTVMRCYSHEIGQTRHITAIVRLDNYLLKASEFYTREDGKWVSGNSEYDGELRKTTTTKDSAVHNVFHRSSAFTTVMAEKLQVKLGDPIFYVVPYIYDFLAQTRRAKPSYHTTLNFEGRYDEGIYFFQRCQID